MLYRSFDVTASFRRLCAFACRLECRHADRLSAPSVSYRLHPTLSSSLHAPAPSVLQTEIDVSRVGLGISAKLGSIMLILRRCMSRPACLPTSSLTATRSNDVVRLVVYFGTRNSVDRICKRKTLDDIPAAGLRTVMRCVAYSVTLIDTNCKLHDLINQLALRF